jgi:hypothetical protein
MKNLTFPKLLMPAGDDISKPGDALRKRFSRMGTILILVGLLAHASAALAQSQQGIFNLKPGDWFEMEVTIANEYKESIEYQKYDLKYDLKKQKVNGNQVYGITLMRMKSTIVGNDQYFGLDTFYPYYENKAEANRKNQYTLEVSPNGDIITFVTDLTNSFKEAVHLELSGRKSPTASFWYTKFIVDSVFIEYSQDIFLPFAKSSFSTSSKVHIGDSLNMLNPDVNIATVNQDGFTVITIPYIKETGVPLLLSKKSTQYLLSSASFPLSGNSIIKGKLENGAGQTFKVSKGDSCEISQNGTFSLPVLLTRPTLLNLKLGNREVNAFMVPGDTLEITADHLSETSPVQFSGSAANNTMLSNELAQINIIYWEGLEVYYDSRERYTLAVSEVFKKYKGIASEPCLDYQKMESSYYLALTKLNCMDNVMMQNRSESMSFLRNLPAGFFEEVDTLQVLINPFDDGIHFNNYLRVTTTMQFYRLMMSNGSKYGFYDKFAFVRSYFSGYPFYAQAYELIREELLSNRKLEGIEPYYLDFINNCNDPKMVGPLKEIYEKGKLLAMGNEFPLKSVVLADGTTFDLTKFKGKPVCLVFIESNLDIHASSFKDYMARFNTDEVEFVFAVMPTYDDFYKKHYARIDTANVTYIDLADNGIKSMFAFEGNRLILLDKWFRIVDNNVEDMTRSRYGPGSVSKFEQSIRKAIEARRYTKAEEAALYKIAGWSFGSILFTILIGVWIYNIRIRSIKKQEAIKRRIKELEVKAIRSQMNPHFIFNALNSIQSLINGNQFKEANIYLSKFAVLLRGVLNNSEKSMVTLGDELQAVELYLQLEQLRFEFQFAIGMSPGVNPNLIEIPGMVIQPLAENAIVHGLSPIRGHGELNIQIDRLNGNLCICVTDNGAGLQLNKPDHLSEKGFGLKLVEERIKILNLEGKEARLQVENRINEPGVTATLTIPIE